VIAATTPPPRNRLQGESGLRAKRAAAVVFSYYPTDPRPRRAAEALVREGMNVDVICLQENETDPRREQVNGVDVFRVPLRRRRGGSLGYVGQYATFLLSSLAILTARSFTRRYDLVHVHNMPDVLVFSALIPKLLGAKVILDLHDPMPELMMTIFAVASGSTRVRALRWLERQAIRFADVVITVNIACKRLFASRSCPADKIRVVMNAPDDTLFRFRPARDEDVRLHAAGAPFVIMYHGSLVERNGVDLAVDALARLRPTIPDPRLRIYGPSTPFLEHVMQSARARNLGDAIQYRGPKHLEEIVSAIHECAVGIIPNRRNLFTELNTPTRIFEYLALGKPVIAPRAAGIQDYFGDDALIYFELGDAADLARKIEHVFLYPQATLETVRRGQAVYHAHAWRREREAFVRLTDELLCGRARLA
jgi:glycosyltransferase involved in cell wall biosynthesis